MVVWQLEIPVTGSTHHYKYRLYYGYAGECLVRYDNESGKGDHVHYTSGETSYKFVSLGQLILDFQVDVERLSGGG